MKIDFQKIEEQFQGSAWNMNSVIKHENPNIEIEIKGNESNGDDLILSFSWNGSQKSKPIEIVNFDIFIHGKYKFTKLEFKNFSFSNNVIFDLMEYGLTFVDCIFEDEIKFHNEKDLEMEYSKSLVCKNCIFNKRVEFFRIKFCQNISFSSSVFKENALFVQSIFEQKARFQLAKFEKTGSFVESLFLGTALFKSAEFHKGMFENVRLGNFCFFQSCILDTNRFSFNGISINGFEGEYNTLIDKLSQYEKSKQAIQMMRDTSRKIKSIFLAQHNIIEASYWNKIELYCREIELKQIKKLSMLDLVDRIQLGFYRHISDHHTNLFKILEWTLVVIACFGIALGLLRYGLDFAEFGKNHHLEFLPSLFSKVAMWFHTNIQCIYVWCCCLFCITLFIPIFRFISSWIVLCLIIVVQPKYILGIGGFIGGNLQMQGNAGENFLFVAYSLLMVLMLFSLQKTARKNSIIQS